jgi:hypothetical protein
MQMRHALRVMHRQAVFQEVLDRTFNRRLVTQTLLGELKSNALAQFATLLP